ncbi:MAG: GNAT family N-acetyltransferase [Candidatus Krumholzibacteria bacterium]|nr:GNAT family N-acetyltransferase [Candidatus Krumholzibacteria bacterium]
MENVKIRAAQREELAAIVSLYNLMWVGSKSPLDVKVGENIFDRMKRKGQRMYVVDVDGRVVGSLMMLVKPGVSSGADSECVLENVVVHPRYQRRGIGKKMMHFATAKCKEAGCSTLFVASGERRQRSAAFYESLGFARRGYGFVKRVE